MSERGKGIQIVNVTEGDLPEILAVQHRAYPAEARLYPGVTLPPMSETIDGLRAAFRQGVILKAVLSGAIVGAVRCALAGGVCQVGRLCVDPAYQKQGIGAGLLRACETVYGGANCLELFTGTRSLSNIRLYERCGFVRCREEAVCEGLTLVYLRKDLRRERL